MATLLRKAESYDDSAVYDSLKGLPISFTGICTIGTISTHTSLRSEYIAVGRRKISAVSSRYEESTSTLVDPFSNRSFEADPEILGHPAYYTFQSELYARKWIACCRAALDCCRRMLSEPYLEENDTLHCPRTWDGWQCWPDTPSGEEAEGLCQEHVYFMSQPPPCP
ncbi:hypothetical protein AVEN_264045-1, partial [Araneus ventricosus]